MLSEEEIKKIFKEIGLLKEKDRKKFLTEYIEREESLKNNYVYSVDSNTTEEGK